MSTIRMQVLVDALCALEVAERALVSLPAGTPQRDAWLQVMNASISLKTQLRMLAPIEVTGIPNEQA